MSSIKRRRVWLGSIGVLLVASSVAACAGPIAGAVGGGILVLLVAGGFLLAGASQLGCGDSSACLSFIPPDADDAPCLAVDAGLRPDADVTACLGTAFEPDADVTPCLGTAFEPDADVTPCLSQRPPPDAYIGPCLSPLPPPDAYIGPCLDIIPNPDAHSELSLPKGMHFAATRTADRAAVVAKLGHRLPADVLARLGSARRDEPKA